MDGLAMMEPVARPLQFGGKGFRKNNDTIPDDVRQFVTKLLIKNSQQHRTAVIIVTVFSVIASLLVIYSILRDAYKIKEGEAYSVAQRRLGFMRILHPAEVFPFVVAVSIVVQGLIFIGVQANGLHDFWADGCGLTAQLIWPAVWIVPLVILVFSLEVTFRSLIRNRFRSRSKWTTPVCIAIVALLLLALWLTAFLMPAMDMCPGQLVRWTVHFSRLGLVFGPGIILTHFISAIILSTQLWRTVKMDRDERIAASRVVYSLGIDVVILILILPFWIDRIVSDDFMKGTADLADIALTLSGLTHSALYVFLRANADRLAIRPTEAEWSSKRGLRIFGPNDLQHGVFISTPLLKQPQQTNDWAEWKNDKTNMKYPPREISNSTDPRRARSPILPTYQATSDNMPISPKSLTKEAPPMTEPQKAALPDYGRSRSKSSYSIFPTTAASRPALTSWMSDKTSVEADPLPLPAPLFGRKHSRNDSTKSSATIEIGMRLSSMQDVQMQHQQLRRPSMSVALPRPSKDIKDEERRVSRPPTLQQRELRRQRASSVSTTDQFDMIQPDWKKTQSQVNKSLPPTPPNDSRRASKSPPPPLTLVSKSSKAAEKYSPTQRNGPPSANSNDYHSPGYSPPAQASPWPLPTKPVQPAESWI